MGLSSVERQRRYRKRHPDRVLAAVLRWSEQNKDRINGRRRERYALDPVYAERQRQKERKRRVIQRNRISKLRSARHKELMNHPGYRLAKLLRNRLRKILAVKNIEKCYSALELVGCSLGELKVHIERQFCAGMDWGNKGKWYIDHIRPIASFEITDPGQQKIAFHFTNLRPIWGKDNIRKGAKQIYLL